MRVRSGRSAHRAVDKTGLVVFVGLSAGDPAGGVATCHLVVMLSAATPFLGSLLAQGSPAAPVGPRLFLTLALSVLGVALLLFGGWLGGELVFRYGVGGEQNGTTDTTHQEPLKSPSGKQYQRSRRKRSDTASKHL